MTVTVARRESETYLQPAAHDGELAQLLDFIAAHDAAGRGAIAPRYSLVGAAAGDQVELPREVYKVLRKVVDALGHGLAVTVAAQAMTLMTQQAADLFASAIDLDDDSDNADLDSVLADLREARRAVVQRRRGVVRG